MADATLTVAGRLYARLLRMAAPHLDDADLREAASVFDETRLAAWRHSVPAWFFVWVRELRALRTTRGDHWPARPPVPAGLDNSGGFRVGRLLENVTRDLHQGVRQIARAPLFSVVAIVSVALGIGGSVTVFTAANSVLWRPLSGVDAPDRLVGLYYGDSVWSYPDFEDVIAAMPAVSGGAAFSSSPAPVAVPGAQAREVVGVRISPGYFSVLGATLVTGRGIRPDDPDDVAVIGSRLWEQDFGGDPRIVGRIVEIRGRPHTIVGVVSADLLSLKEPIAPQVYYPVDAEERSQRHWFSLSVVARMRDGTSLDQVTAQADAAAITLAEADPGAQRRKDGQVRPIHVAPGAEMRVPPRDRMTVLGAVAGALGLTGLILLVATTNLANMVLTRGLRRSRELAIRRALGGGRARIVGGLLAESLVLAVLAGGLALFTIHVATSWLESGPVFAAVPAGIDLRTDWRVAAFALGVAGLAGLAVGWLPALHVTRTSLTQAINNPTATGTSRRISLRGLLVTAQLAASLVLVVAATLCARSLSQAQNADIGFEPAQVAIAEIDLNGREYSDEAARQLFDSITARVAVLPGVDGVALSRTVPLSGSRMRSVGFEVEGYDAPEDAPTMASGNYASPGYFSMLEMRLLAGREFTADDRDGAEPVAIVNESFTKRYLPGRPAIGAQVDGRTVVGVAADSALESINDMTVPAIWRPVAQVEFDRLVVHARVRGDLRPVLHGMDRIIRGEDPALFASAQPMTDRMNALVLPRILSMVFGAAGLLALALAALGVYGVMSYLIGLRVREMGIRLALGSTRGRLIALIMRDGASMAAVGFGVGLLLAAGVGFALQSILVGIPPLDPIALGLGTGVLGVTAAVACYLPARRAARIDPVSSLRSE